MNDAERAAYFEGVLTAISNQAWNGYDSFTSIKTAATVAIRQQGTNAR